MKKVAAIIFPAVLIIAVAVYFFFIPLVLSQRYTNKIQTTARPLQSLFNDIDRSTELPIISDLSISEAERTKNAEYITGLIQVSQQKINELKNSEDTLKPLPYSEISGQYEKARALQEHTKRFTSQSEEALSGYQALIAYLGLFGKVVSDTSTQLESFNTVRDLNSYEGKADTVRQMASDLRVQASLLAASSPPLDMESINAAVIAAINEAANGFDDLAGGLSIPADAPIYAAAKRIEAATTRLDSLKNTTYGGNLDQSRVIKNIQDLSEKIDAVLET